MTTTPPPTTYSTAIWKYPLVPIDVQTISMPRGARLLHVAGIESNAPHLGPFLPVTDPTIWAQVDTRAPSVMRLIAIVATGSSCPTDSQGVYVGTAICPPYVWHVFDGGEVPA